jgi:hypothetical protein
MCGDDTASEVPFVNTPIDPSLLILCCGCRPTQRPTSGHSTTDSSLSPAQAAAAALKSCSITQRQLARLDTAGTTADCAARLLFLDPELLQLEDPQQRSIMIQGLKVSCMGSYSGLV